MKITKFPQTLGHHAYCLVNRYDCRQYLIEIINKNFNIPIQANPDLIVSHFETLSIDDARQIKENSLIRPISSAGKKIFIISFNNIGHEAQNALLKLLEEPSNYVHFFIRVPSIHILLPTVKSRLNFIDFEFEQQVKDEAGGQSNDWAKKFIKAKVAKRLEMIKDLVDDIQKERATKQSAIDFLNSLEIEVRSSLGVIKGRKMLEAIDTAKKYANDRAPSIKMLLESVVLIT